MTDRPGPEQEKSPEQSQVEQEREPSADLSINPAGCRVEKLILRGTEIAFAGTRPDGNQGSWHPCLPYFGPYQGEHKGKKPPSHGTARNERWQVQEAQNDNTQVLTWNMQEIPEVYPAGMQATRTYKVYPSSGLLSVETHIVNATQEPIRLNPGEHVYLLYPADRRDEIMINGIPTVTEEQDLWAGAGTIMEAQATNRAVLPGLGIITLTLEGFSGLGLWSQVEASDFETGVPFVCIEGVNNPQEITQDEKILPPEEERTFALGLMFDPE